MIVLCVCLCAGLIAGFVLGVVYRRKREKQASLPEPEEVFGTEGGLEDVLCLANANIMSELAALVAEHKVVEHMPGFYENFQFLIKQGQEDYYTELWRILSHYRGEYLQKLQNCGLKLSTQDLILLLLCELRKDNKTIAHIMGINLETLKKRKTRLKSKFTLGGLDFEAFMREGVSQPAPLVGE